MIIEYQPNLAPALADIHHRYASIDLGLTGFSKDHWELQFLLPEIDPRRDVVIVSRDDTPEPDAVAAFCWLYSKHVPSFIYMRGPYIDPQDPDLARLLDVILSESAARANDYGAGHIEGRSIYPAWTEAYGRAGYQLMGVYERWRIFPLRGAILQPDPPEDGEIRVYKGTQDIPILMGLFDAAFKDHWDYIRTGRKDWEDMARGRLFEKELLLIGDEQGVPAGYVFGQKIPDFQSKGITGAYLVSIGIAPDFAGRGWGSALLGGWLRACYDNGIRSVELDVDKNNDAAKALYNHFGFRRLRSEEVWRRYLIPSDSVG